MHLCRLPLWGRISADLLDDPSRISLSNSPVSQVAEERLTGTMLHSKVISMIVGPYFLLLLASKDTSLKMYVIWAGVLLIRGGVCLFAWSQFVNAAAPM